MRSRRNPHRAALLLAAALLVGCASSPKVALRISPASDTNDRRPCYVLVRTVDTKTYMGDSYATIASMVMTPDDSVVASALVFPGTPKELTLSPPQKGQLAVYVLFTYPSGDWKTLLPSPSPEQVEIKLGQHRLYAPAAK
ncbi:hypothetical protein [Polyangium aurulentum]|uniref:hypothetical protein n=1 Tax=Polyangium aurulentum TaxID=2567896 RepID=UPI0010AE5333|nr:hypothetical protein [Polyangium aurulentum]UQA56288.1 hypothetical protein E8A73_033970 [Polyangium aurulentum]